MGLLVFLVECGGVIDFASSGGRNGNRVVLLSAAKVS